MRKSAVISGCERYRYRLLREWSSFKPPVMWIMLNPSTADAVEDDRTIGRVMAFSKEWGFGSALVGNLFAYRATKPAAMLSLPLLDAVGPDNSYHLYQMALASERIVCAWGSHAAPQQLALLALPKTIGGMWCLGRTRAGSPRHPLYLPASTPLEPFP